MIVAVILLMPFTAYGSDASPESPSEKEAGSSASNSIVMAACQRHLLADLVDAYENPSAKTDAAIRTDLLLTRMIDPRDSVVARSIADNWKHVYANPEYQLFIHGNGESAEALKNAGLPDDDKHAFVVLGNALVDGAMSDELKGRCDAVCAAHRSFPKSRIVCTGGATGENNLEGKTEAGVMKAYLVDECGIDESCVLVEEEALSTAQNAINTMRVLHDQDIRSFTIVTSTYHQRRAQAVFNAAQAQYFKENGYETESVGNYCYQGESAQSADENDDRVAAIQIAQILNLPDEMINHLPGVE